MAEGSSTAAASRKPSYRMSFVCASDSVVRSTTRPSAKSVTPATIQICVLAGGAIIAADAPTPHAAIPYQRCPLGLLARAEVGCESCPARMVGIRRRNLLANFPGLLHGQQLRSAATQSPRLIQPAPVENQVGVDSVYPRNTGGVVISQRNQAYLSLPIALQSLHPSENRLR
jgi:hypothetical protein